MKPLVVLLLVLAGAAALFFALRKDNVDEVAVTTPTTTNSTPVTPRTSTDSPSAVQPTESRTAETATSAQPGDPSGEPSAPRSNSLAGLVVNDQGQPIPNATVVLSRNAMMGEALANEWFMGQQKPKGKPAQTTTDAQGQYRFKNVEPASGYYIVARHADYSPTQESGVNVGEEGDFRAPDAVLRAGSLLSGYVYDEANNPIANATVHLDSAYVMGDDAQSPDRVSATTNNTGYFEIKNVAGGPRNITAVADGFGLQTKSNLMFKGATDDHVQQDFKLGPGHPLAGRVVVQGSNQGLAGVRVVAMNYGNNTSSRGETISGEDGAWQIMNLQLGSYLIMSELECYRPVRLNRVQVDDMNVLVEMVPRATVSGRVIDASGNGVATYDISARRVSGGAGQPTLYENAEIDQHVESPDGSFTLCNFDPGDYVLYVLAPGFAGVTSEPFKIVADQQSGPAITVRLSVGGSIRGRVVDASGNPIQGALISSHGNDLGENVTDPLFQNMMASSATERRSRSDRDGNFELRQLAATDYQIIVTHPSYTRQIITNLRVIEGQPTDAGSITMRAGGSVRGKVLDPAGAPVVRGYVHLQSTVDASISFEVRTAGDGRYEVVHVPPGQYQLSATRSAPGGSNDPFQLLAEQQASQVSINVVDGQEVPRDLQIGG